MSSHTSWEQEEVRSKTDSSPLSFPLSYVHRGFVILSLVSCFGFWFSCLVYSMQKSHLNVCFSTHVSKSRLNFYFTSNHCWMAELLGSLIITVAASGVCPVPPPRPRRPHSVAIWRSSRIQNVFTHPCFLSFRPNKNEW